MDANKFGVKQRRGSVQMNDRSKKSKRAKKNKKTRRVLTTETEAYVSSITNDNLAGDNVTSGSKNVNIRIESDSDKPHIKTIRSLVSNINLNDDRANHDTKQHRPKKKDTMFKKSSQSLPVKVSSSSSSGGLQDEINCNKDFIKDYGVTPLWLADNFLKYADSACDFDEPVWKSICLSLTQQSSQPISAVLCRESENASSRLQATPGVSSSSAPSLSESLRWELMMDESNDEMERLRVYKINRRKRYLAERHRKGLDSSYILSANGSGTNGPQPAVTSTYIDINKPSHAFISPVLKPIINSTERGREFVLNVK